MRQMKYIKLFEAFDSVQLGKTMKFVKKADKDRFLEALKSIADSIDAPLSALSDDSFQYLPYKKAISVKADSAKVDCPSCKGEGKVSKAWGSGTRRVKCASCDGEGKVDQKSKIKYFKFWFDSEGKFVGTTAVDGLYHISKKDSKNFVKKDITADARAMSGTEMKAKYSIVNGETKFYLTDIIASTYRRRPTTVLGTGFVDRDGGFFVIHNNSDAASGQPTGRKWKDFGRYATGVRYVFSKSENAGAKAYLMTDIEEKEDIFWNAPVSFYGNGWRISEDMSKDFLKDAHFAIVFDYESFSKKSFSLVSATKEEREKSKEGATALMSEEDIKSQNIERYVKSLTDIDISQGMGRIISRIPMIFGGDLALYYIYAEKNFSAFKNMMSDVYDFMAAESDEERKRANERLSNRLRDVREIVGERNERISKRLLNANSEISENPELKALLDKLDELSKKINAKLLRGKMESIEDMEIMMAKAIGIRSALTSDRLELPYNLRNYISGLDSTGWRSSSAYLDYLTSLGDSSIAEAMRKLGLISNVIERI